MKKLFFTFWALITVSLFSVSLSSCNKDNESTQPTEEPVKKTTYKFDYAVSTDVYDLYDIKTTLTEGNTSCDLVYSKDTTLTVGTENYKVKSLGPKVVEVKPDTKVATKATFTLKSNWKEIITSKKTIDLIVKADVYVNGGAIRTNLSPVTIDTDDYVGNEQLLHDYLTAKAEAYEIHLGYSSDQK